MRKLSLLLICGLFGSAQAATFFPAEGVWQFPESNGSGLTLDYRDGTRGIGLYSYDDEGNSVWYSGAGQLQGGVLETSLAVYRETATPGSVEAVGEPRAFRLEFANSTQATLAFDGTEDIPVHHAAFGADYVNGWSPGTEVYPLPDMRGRWLFATRPSVAIPQPQAYDIEFAATTVTNNGNTATFRSIDYPVDGLPDTVRSYEVVCSAQSGLPTSCLLSGRNTPLADGETPVLIAEFHPRDLMPNRVVGINLETDAIGFRQPADPLAAPMPGIWQIVGRNGSGMTLDVRENGMAVGLFTYDDEGNATWSLAQGPIVEGTLAAPLLSFSGGSCLGCPQEDPTAAPDPVTINLQFIGATRALMTIGDSEPVPVSLLPYGTQFAPLPMANDSLEEEFGPHLMPLLAGQWVFSQGDIATERQPDDAFALDFVAIELTPNAEGDRTDYLSARASPIVAPEGADWDTELHRFECTTFGEAPEATCEANMLRQSEGVILDPPPPATALATATLSDVSGNRIRATGAGDMTTPVWGFRIPPRP